MLPKMNTLWLTVIILAGLFSLLYLWYTFFPGRMAPDALNYFSAEQANRGRQYNRMLRLLFIGSFAVQSTFLIWLVFSGRAVGLSRWTQQLAGGNFWLGLLLFFLCLWLVLRLLNLPFSLYSGYYWQHHWGFSTQSMAAWWLDYLKGAGLDLILSAVGVVLLFWTMGRWPGTWWLAGAVFVSFWFLVQTFLWPVLISPMFNRFEPVTNPVVVNMVRELSHKAQLPVEQVLVMDASRRTTRANAYFAGLGRTKRIVLYDTLLANYSPNLVKAVVAHEMAHWSQGHILRGLAWGILGSFLLWGLLFVVLRLTFPQAVQYQSHVWAIILLFFLLVSFIGSPLQNYISRSMEEEADRVAVIYTGDAPGAVRLQVDLAAKNMSDIAPAPFIQWFSYSHPPAPTRINNIQQAGKQLP